MTGYFILGPIGATVQVPVPIGPKGVPAKVGVKLIICDIIVYIIGNITVMLLWILLITSVLEMLLYHCWYYCHVIVGIISSIIGDISVLLLLILMLIFFNIIIIKTLKS